MLRRSILLLVVTALDPSGAPANAAMVTDAALLVRAELALDALGYPVEPPDGMADAATTRALRAFRTRAGLPLSPGVDLALAKALEEAVARAEARRRALAAARRAEEERLVRADLAAKRARVWAGVTSD